MFYSLITQPIRARRHYFINNLKYQLGIKVRSLFFQCLIKSITKYKLPNFARNCVKELLCLSLLLHMYLELEVSMATVHFSKYGISFLTLTLTSMQLFTPMFLFFGSYSLSILADFQSFMMIIIFMRSDIFTTQKFELKKAAHNVVINLHFNYRISTSFDQIHESI